MNRIAIWITAAGSLLITVPTLAQFKAKEPPPIRKSNPLECAILSRTETDIDPVYKIEVNVGFTEDGKLDTIYVVHTTIGGSVYDRSQQYTQDTNLWQNPNGQKEYYWKGTRHGSVMVGEVYRTQEGKWFYSEKLFKNNHEIYEMLSGCHSTSNDTQ